MNFGGNNNYDALLSGLGEGYSSKPKVTATGGITQASVPNRTVDLWDYSTPVYTTSQDSTTSQQTEQTATGYEDLGLDFTKPFEVTYAAGSGSGGNELFPGSGSLKATSGPFVKQTFDDADATLREVANILETI